MSTFSKYVHAYYFKNINNRFSKMAYIEES